MVFEGGLFFWKNPVIFDPIDRIRNSGGFQPSVHSETASSTIFYLWVWKKTFFVFENPEILSTPGWLYVYIYREREREGEREREKRASTTGLITPTHYSLPNWPYIGCRAVPLVRRVVTSYQVP